MRLVPLVRFRGPAREGRRSSRNHKARPYHHTNRDAVSRGNVAVSGAKSGRFVVEVSAELRVLRSFSMPSY